MKLYKIVAYKDDARWIVAKHIASLVEAEAIQARLYAAHVGTDFYIE
jgi:hypothetical protein